MLSTFGFVIIAFSLTCDFKSQLQFASSYNKSSTNKKITKIHSLHDLSNKYTWLQNCYNEYDNSVIHKQEIFHALSDNEIGSPVVRKKKVGKRYGNESTEIRTDTPHRTK